MCLPNKKHYSLLVSSRTKILLPSQPFLANLIQAMAQALSTLLGLRTREALHADLPSVSRVSLAWVVILSVQLSYCFMLPIRTDHSPSRNYSLYIYKHSLPCYPLNSPFTQKLIQMQALLCRTSGTITRNASVTRLPCRQNPLPGQSAC